MYAIPQSRLFFSDDSRWQQGDIKVKQWMIVQDSEIRIPFHRKTRFTEVTCLWSPRKDIQFWSLGYQVSHSHAHTSHFFARVCVHMEGSPQQPGPSFSWGLSPILRKLAASCICLSNPASALGSSMMLLFPGAGKFCQLLKSSTHPSYPAGLAP